jgi:hypothetical protein
MEEDGGDDEGRPGTEDLQAAHRRAVIADRQMNGRYERVPAILFCNQPD